MKKLLCVLLAMLMLLSLAACADNVPDETEGEKEPEKLQLVTEYRTKGGVLSQNFGGELTLEFSYNEDYSAGNVALRGGEELAAGRFTCDKDHNITGITLTVDGYQLQMDMTYDSHGRLLTTHIRASNDQEERTVYFTERRFDSKGRVVYNEQKIEAQSFHTVVETTYDNRGFVTEQVTTQTFNETTNRSRITYVFDDQGALSAIETYDADDNLVMRMPFTCEETTDGILCTYTEGAQSMKLLLDDKGHMLQQEVYSNDSLSMKMVSTYDKAGRCTSTETQNLALGYTHRTEYAFLADGRQVSVRQYNGEELISFSETTYATVTP